MNCFKCLLFSFVSVAIVRQTNKLVINAFQDKGCHHITVLLITMIIKKKERNIDILTNGNK